MRIEKTKESTVIEVKLTDAPSMQMFSGVGYTSNLTGFYTWEPRTAVLRVVDGAFDSIVLHYDHSMGRSFKAADANMPNWIRDLVIDLLVSVPGASWPLATERVNEYVIERQDENYETVMSVAVVDPNEVARFLRQKRDKYQPSDFLVRRTEGGGTVAGDLWLLRHTKAAV